MKEILSEIKFRIDAYGALKDAMFKHIQGGTATPEMIDAYHATHNKWSEYCIAHAALTSVSKNILTRPSGGESVT